MNKYKYEEPYYILYNDNTGEELWRGEKVAVALSYQPELEISGTLLKHGSPEKVEAWFRNTRTRFYSASNDLSIYNKINEAFSRLGKKSSMSYEEHKRFFLSEIESLKLVSGKFNVEELNKCIEITGYIGKFYESLIEKNAEFKI